MKPVSINCPMCGGRLVPTGIARCGDEKILVALICDEITHRSYVVANEPWFHGETIRKDTK